jgi:2-dehydro-3-deoxyphosphogluconate aldolase/(4S)-4-hydroxy-2-oxoglutarate aldolase
MKSLSSVTNTIVSNKILPLFYHDDPAKCINIVNVLYNSGIKCIEFTNRGKNALNNFKEIVQHRNTHWKDLLVGIGTIQEPKSAEQFINAEADFLISPFIDKSISDVAYLNKTLWMPGCMTPTEIHVAEDLGWNLVKLFPGNVLGTGFVQSIKPVFPTIDFVVTGGVNLLNMQDWYLAGASVVGMGSSLITAKDMDSDNYSDIAMKTISIVNFIQQMNL